MSITYFTICSANYLAYARVLYRSLAKVDPKAAETFTVFLADRMPEQKYISDIDFRIIPSTELSIPSHTDMTLRYSVMEFNTAIKPFCIEYLFEENTDAAIYLDPDILVFQPLGDVHQLLGAGANIVLTPHSLSPLEDGFRPNDVTLMQTGVYNLGFGAFANTEETKKYIKWWGRQLETKCIVALESGIFVDQKFMDMAPAYCAGTEILRHPGYNVAYWNLANREVSLNDKTYTSNGATLIFFHFSGVIPDDPSVFSKHQDRFEVKDIGCVSTLLNNYLDALHEERHQDYTNIEYAFAQFPNGENITAMHRQCYAKINPSPILDASTAYESAKKSPRNAATELKSFSNLPINMAMQTIWEMRPDLALNFPIGTKAGCEQFFRWYITSGSREHDLPDEVVQPIKSALSSLDNMRQSEHLSASRRSIRAIARASISSLPFTRAIFRKLPKSWRSNIRERIFRAASSQPSEPIAAKISRRGDLNPDLQSGIGLYGYLTSVSGVGEGARRTIKSLQSVDIAHTKHLAISHSGTKTDTSINDITESDTPYRIVLFHVNADQTPHVLNSMPPSSIDHRYRIGHWAWELSEFPDIWCDAFEYLDEVWVPTEFVASSIRKKTQKPVFVVPYAVSSILPGEKSRVEFGLPSDRFLVLCSLDLNSYSDRKNPDASYEAFIKAFPNSTETSPMLVMKLHGGLEGSNRDKIIERYLNDERVIVIDAALSAARYTRLQQSCDAYISLHRSEGFGLNIAECMLMGKPVIVTNYGGNTDFTNNENAYLVDYVLTELREGQYVVWQDQVWADPDLEHAAKQLQKMFFNAKERELKTQIAKRHIQERFSPESVGSLISKHLKRISKEFYPK